MRLVKNNEAMRKGRFAASWIAPWTLGALCLPMSLAVAGESTDSAIPKTTEAAWTTILVDDNAGPVLGEIQTVACQSGMAEDEKKKKNPCCCCSSESDDADKDSDDDKSDDDLKDCLKDKDDDDSDDDDTDDYGLLSKWTGLDKVGLNVTVNWNYNTNTVMTGGLFPGDWSDQNIGQVAFILDTSKKLGWEGGLAQVEFLHRRGSEATTLAGDVLDFNGFDVNPEERAELYQLFFLQKLFDDKFELAFGKICANNYFAAPNNANMFLGNAFGTLPGMVQYMIQYPDAATGIQGFLKPNDNLYAGVGFYDGRYGGEGTYTGQNGPQFNGYYFYIGEAGISYTLDHLDGTIAAGGWGQSGQLTRFDGSIQNGTAGFYLMLDQMLWKESPCDKDDDQGIAGFFTWSTGDGRVNQFTQGMTVGFQWTGMIPKRDNDIWGFGIAWGKQTNAITSATSGTTQNQFYPDLNPPFNNGRMTANEWEYQWFYNYQWNDYIQLQPNLTYIHDAGRSTLIKDPVAFTMEVILNF